MELQKEEKEKLEKFKTGFKFDKLTRDQVDLILDRKITNIEWARYSRVPRVKRQIPLYKIPKWMFKEHKSKKSLWSRVAKQAANKALAKRNTPEIEEKRARRQQKEEVEDYYFMKSLYNHPDDKRTIRKVREYTNEKYKTTRSDWKVVGDIDIFRMHSTIRELVNKMTEYLPDNVKIQVSLVNTKNDRTVETKLLNKDEVTQKLAEWVNLFIDYYDMDIEDITFKLMSIEIPKGEGRPNAVINAENKRSIIQIRNYDTICLARAIVVALAINHTEKFQVIFKNNLTEAEIKVINYRRQTKTQVNNGTLSDNEKLYLIDGRKLQEVLAKAIHRICKIPTKEEGHDLADVKQFEEKLNIQINVYNFETRSVYRGADNETKVNILMSDNHYDVISNLPGFLGTKALHHYGDKMRCKACNNATKCKENEPRITCERCGKYFYGQTCLENHIKNKKCIEDSYICQKCCRFFKTRELRPELHKCDQIKCDNCKAWVSMDHNCFMLQKDLRKPSERYIFFDFETCVTQNKKHEVNFAVAQYLCGEEKVFGSADELCKWVFTKKKHRDYTVIAHYGKGYDFQFLAEWLVAHAVKPKIIHNGQHILQLEVKQDYNIRFIDSISFMLMTL